MTKHPFRPAASLRAIALAAGLAALGAGSAACAEEVADASADEDGLTLKTGDIEFNLGGRLHLDASVFEHGLTDGSDADVRRARLEFSAKFGDVVTVRVDREFAQADGWRNLWLAVEPVEGLEIKGGNMIVPFSMEDMQSSNTMPLAERSLANSFSPGFGLGGSVKYAGESFTIAGGYFTDALDDEVGQSRVRGDGYVLRATFAPVRERDSFLHLGAAYEHRSFNAAEPPRFTAISASSLAPNLASTGALAGARTLDAYNAEFAYSRGGLQVQAQYIAATIDRVAAPGLDFNGWYVGAGWLVTGERYGYSRASGVPSGARIGKKGGAVELNARYSRADLDDPALDRGTATILTAGATWYITRNIRVLANYAHTRTAGSALVPDASGNLGLVRFQLAF
ncbi:OprO/OprP family phosphate-selective porin [Erythrobacter oryzae]|uniref:OprO/OprP family phosphate-selective porin n=1 Tax=Erythrobacter oryzae TaxID=3019556 RepID=UPI002556AFF7|nr:porin [Erythrobacter sp. COR-2]